MARGRMISKSLSTSQRFARLFKTVPELAEFAQSLYPLLMAHTDDFGRQAGDLFTVKHKVHPASPRTEAEFERALQAMHNEELIVWYPDGRGGHVVQITQFEKHQSGLHKRTRSEFPKPPGDSGKFPEPPETHGSGNFPEVPPQGPESSHTTELNRTELKRRDPEDQDPRADARRTLMEFTETAEVRNHLKAAVHACLDATPDAQDSDLAEVVKDAAGKLRVIDYNGREASKIVDAVRGERARRRPA